MPDSSIDREDPHERIGRLSGAARRLAEFVAIAPGSRYAVLRHLAHVTEEDMIEDLRECVDAGILVSQSGEPNRYDLASNALREAVLATIGELRLPKLRARAEAARRRVEGLEE
jgi:hypothetical protein